MNNCEYTYVDISWCIMDNINISIYQDCGFMVRWCDRERSRGIRESHPLRCRPSYGSRLGLGSPSRARRHTITSLTTRPCLSEGVTIWGRLEHLGLWINHVNIMSISWWVGTDWNRLEQPKLNDLMDWPYIRINDILKYLQIFEARWSTQQRERYLQPWWPFSLKLHYHWAKICPGVPAVCLDIDSAISLDQHPVKTDPRCTADHRLVSFAVWKNIHGPWI